MKSKNIIWDRIAKKVLNLKKEHPAWATVRSIVNEFSMSKGCRKFKYARCGRKPWKVTNDVQNFVIRQLLAQRISKIVTSVTLQADLAAQKGVVLEVSTVRKILKAKGYNWFPRSQKRRYSKDAMLVRTRFAAAVLRLTKAALREKFCMSMDGVVLSMPPENET